MSEAGQQAGAQVQLGELVAEGKTKSLYACSEPDLLVMEFRDDVTAHNKEKHQEFAGKGALNNGFTALVMQELERRGVATHFVRQLDERRSLVRRMRMLPVECVVRNKAAGSLCRRLGIEPDLVLDPPLVEFFLKDDERGDPLINRAHMRAFGWATAEEADAMERASLGVNGFLQQMFAKAGLELIDFKLEYGWAGDRLCLGDEVTPDGCRLRTLDGRSLDKDVFRDDKGDLMQAYREAAEAIGASTGS